MQTSLKMLLNNTLIFATNVCLYVCREEVGVALSTARQEAERSEREWQQERERREREETDLRNEVTQLQSNLSAVEREKEQASP